MASPIDYIISKTSSKAALKLLKKLVVAGVKGSVVELQPNYLFGEQFFFELFGKNGSTHVVAKAAIKNVLEYIKMNCAMDLFCGSLLKFVLQGGGFSWPNVSSGMKMSMM